MAQSGTLVSEFVCLFTIHDADHGHIIIPIEKPQQIKTMPGFRFHQCPGIYHFSTAPVSALVAMVAYLAR